eukprot:TRINITY_DN12003_c0_g1_i1.p2 TRINITY_DN12003_c0_g1~~TRINITY_DN12003_c0_g1_i1.p2  ORF type:complete len:116 (+),score=23.26 TRINITY_DN12003_c0_g1_i1:243-590(+)
MLLFCNKTCLRLVRFPILPERVPDRFWLGAPSVVTRFSGEHEIIAQLQGSTEASSQLLRTPWGSFREFLILIKASTSGLRGSKEKDRVAEYRKKMKLKRLKNAMEVAEAGFMYEI